MAQTQKSSEGSSKTQVKLTRLLLNQVLTLFGLTPGDLVMAGRGSPNGVIFVYAVKNSLDKSRWMVGVSGFNTGRPS